MDSKELYQKKQKAIEARRKLASHGSSYDSASTTCFAFILLAMAVSGAGFFFIVMSPGDPAQFILNMAYIGGGVLLLFIIIVTIVRLMHRHSRKPLIKKKKRYFAEYEQAVRSTLKYEYGLIPVNDDEFVRRLLHGTFDDMDSSVLPVMSLDGQQTMNLTLKEFDEDSLVFTKHGVPYQPSLNYMIRQEPSPELAPQTQVLTPVAEENISITELFKKAQLQ